MSWSIKHHKPIKKRAHKEPDYLRWLHEAEQPPCMVCKTYLGVQMHHVKENSASKRNDNEVIPLCYEHHTGFEFSVHGTARKFKEEYPMDYQLFVADRLYNKYKESKC